jgi:hypothetical protein
MKSFGDTKTGFGVSCVNKIILQNRMGFSYSILLE